MLRDVQFYDTVLTVAGICECIALSVALHVAREYDMGFWDDGGGSMANELEM